MKNNPYIITPLCIFLTFFLFTCNQQESEVFVFNDLKIIQMDPVAGVAGDSVRIRGENFATQVTENQVYFNKTKATVLSATRNELWVLVPEGATTGSLAVQVGKKKTIGEDFAILDKPIPVINEFSPLKGRVGEEITVSGQYFEQEASLNTVILNGAPCKVTFASTNLLKFRVPLGAGSGKIKVTVNARTGESKDVFEFIPFAPQIFSIGRLVGGGRLASGGLSAIQAVPIDSPLDEGDVIIIQGRYFDPNPSGNIVNFETSQGRRGFSYTPPYPPPVALMDTNTIVMKIPFGAVTGRLSVKVFGQETFFNAFPLIINERNTWKERRASPMPATLGNGGFYQWIMDDIVYLLPRGTADAIDREFWAYDYRTNTWSRKADFGRTAIGGGIDPNATTRNQGACFVVNGKAYLVGGKVVDNNQPASEIDVWEYDPQQNRWARKQNFAPEGFPRTTVRVGGRPINFNWYLMGAQGWSLGQGSDQRGYIGFNGNVAGGQTFPPPPADYVGKESRRIWIYHPALDQNYDPTINKGRSQAWSEIGNQANPALESFSSEIGGTAVVSSGGKLYIVTPQGNIWEYTNGGGPTDSLQTNDSWIQRNYTLINGQTPRVPIVKVFSGQNKIYIVYNQCYPLNQFGFDFMPFGEQVPIFEIDVQAGTATQLNGFAGEDGILSPSIVGFVVGPQQRVFMGLSGPTIDLPPPARCTIFPGRDLWEYIR